MESHRQTAFTWSYGYMCCCIESIFCCLSAACQVSESNKIHKTGDNVWTATFELHEVCVPMLDVIKIIFIFTFFTRAVFLVFGLYFCAGAVILFFQINRLPAAVGVRREFGHAKFYCTMRLKKIFISIRWFIILPFQHQTQINVWTSLNTSPLPLSHHTRTHLSPHTSQHRVSFVQ